MRPVRSSLLATLSFLMLLVGCGTGANPFAAPDLTGNWQIQSGSATTAGTSSATGVILLGALTSNGSQVAGTFRYTNLSNPQCDLNEVVSVSGSVDSKDTLTLTSSKLTSGGVVKISLLAASVIGNTSLGNVQVAGGSCPYASGAAVGVQFPSVTGSYTGTLFPGTLANPGTTGGGTATLSLTQAATPNADGQFNVTGKLDFAVGTCSTTTTLSGTISGTGLQLTFANLSAGQAGSALLLAFDPPSGSPLKVAEAAFLPGPCASVTQGPMTFTGTLTKQ